MPELNKFVILPIGEFVTNFNNAVSRMHDQDIDTVSYMTDAIIAATVDDKELEMAHDYVLNGIAADNTLSESDRDILGEAFVGTVKDIQSALRTHNLFDSEGDCPYYPQKLSRDTCILECFDVD